MAYQVRPLPEPVNIALIKEEGNTLILSKCHKLQYNHIIEQSLNDLLHTQGKLLARLQIIAIKLGFLNGQKST